MAISFGFDPIAFLTSLFAVWFAYSESKKNNKVLVKIIYCKSIEKDSTDPKHRGWCSEYSLVIRNLGISIHDPKLILNFRDKAGFGRIFVPLTRADERTGEHSEFARGMIAEFNLKSYEVDPAFHQILKDLQDFAQQDTQLTLYSQGYIAKSFYVGRRSNRLAVLWNSLAFNFNRLFDRKVGEHGLKMHTIIKEDFLDLSSPLRNFIHQINAPSGL